MRVYEKSRRDIGQRVAEQGPERRSVPDSARQLVDRRILVLIDADKSCVNFHDIPLIFPSTRRNSQRFSAIADGLATHNP